MTELKTVKIKTVIQIPFKYRVIYTVERIWFRLRWGKRALARRDAAERAFERRLLFGERYGYDPHE